MSAVSASATIRDNVTYANVGLELGLGTRQVLAGLNSRPHLLVDVLPVGTAEHRARAEQGERVVRRARIVDRDVPQHVLADLLREINVDTQEVGCRLRLATAELAQDGNSSRSTWAASTSCRSVWNQPNEGASRQTQKNSTRFRDISVPRFWRYQMCFRIEANGVTPGGVVVNSPPTRELIVRRTDTGTDKNGNFDIEYILSGRAERAVKTDFRQVLCARSQLNVGATGAVDGVVLLRAGHGGLRHGLNDRRAGAESVTERVGPVANLANVDGDVGILRGRRDGKLQ